MRVPSLHILAGLLIVLNGCGGSQESDLVMRSDSAGVEIVTNNVTAAAPVCTVDATPVVSIGVTEGPNEYELYRVFGATQLSDGRIALVNQGSQQLRMYDASGRHQFNAGREGRGPGEFADAFQLWRMPGDTLWVGDYRPWQFLVFSPSGEYVRTVRPHPQFPNPPGVVEVLPDGRQLLAVRPLTSEGANWSERELTIVIYGPNGTAGDTLGTYPNGRWGKLPDHPNLGLYPLFESFFRIDAGHDVIVTGHSSEPQLEVRNTDEDLALRRIIRWTAGPREITPDDIAAEHRRLAERYEDVDPAMRHEFVAPLVSEDRPIAERFPAYVSLRVGREGRVWVREFVKPSEAGEDRWMVFSAEGSFGCRAVLPESEEVLEIGADYILAKTQDDLGVERVVKWRLSPPAIAGNESR